MIKECGAYKLITNDLNSTRDIINSLKWLDVSDVQPEDGEEVLAISVTPDGTRHVCLLEYFMDDNSFIKNLDMSSHVKGFYDFDGEYGYFKCDGIAKWLPVPKL